MRILIDEEIVPVGSRWRTDGCMTRWANLRSGAGMEPMALITALEPQEKMETVERDGRWMALNVGGLDGRMLHRRFDD